MTRTRAALVRGLAAIVVVIALAGAVLGVAGSRIGQGLADAARAVVPAGPSLPSDRQSAVRLVIDRSNQAQALAFKTGDPSPMQEYATAAFYERLIRTNADLRTSGVAEIALVATEVRDVTVAGASAKATTFETWRSTYQDGSTEEVTARNDYTLVERSGAWRIDADDQSARAARPAPLPSPETGTPAAARASTTSANWSGYAATGGTFTSVKAAWTVPTVAATTPGADATWVGIGGLDSRDLIQAGTQATVSGGSVEYEAWIELLPASSRRVSLAVTAGDAVSVRIAQQSGDRWTIDMRNDTTGERYLTTVTYTSTRSSAEWIEEAPSVGRATVALDGFGSVSFASAAATRTGETLGLRDLGAQAITMINGARQALAQPSVVGADGASFTVTRTAAASTAGGGAPRRRGG